MSQDLASALPQLRRIVTRHNSDGKSEVGIDTTVSAEVRSNVRCNFYATKTLIQSFPGFNVDIGTIWIADGVPSKDNNLE
jgi:hypothetical protein